MNTSPEALGVSSAGIMAYLDALEASGQELHGLIMLRHGQVVCDMAWSPYRRDEPHMLFSLTKSFTSTAVGFAEAEGLLSLDDTVAGLLPDKLPENPSDALLSITVENLLCMGSGLAPESDWFEPGVADWAKRTLSFPVAHTPGSTFHYNSQGSNLLSEIVQRVTGQKLRDYLVPRLFAPLGIAPPKWEENPMGVNMGGWGLFLTTADIAKFGQLLLQDGMWEGRRVLPEGWVRRATEKHISNGDDPNSDWAQGYGYQFWRCRNGHYRGDGMCGQICMVVEAKDAVIAITAGLDDMGMEMQLLHDYLVPAMDAPPADTQTRAALQARIEGLAHPFPAAGAAPAQMPQGQYRADDGSSITFTPQAEQVLAIASTGPMDNDTDFSPSVQCGLGKPYTNEATDPKLPYRQALCGYGWQDAHTMVILIRAMGTPFHTRHTMAFSGDALRVTTTGIGTPQTEQTFHRVTHD